MRRTTLLQDKLWLSCTIHFIQLACLEKQMVFGPDNIKDYFAFLMQMVKCCLGKQQKSLTFDSIQEQLISLKTRLENQVKSC